MPGGENRAVYGDTAASGRSRYQHDRWHRAVSQSTRYDHRQWLQTTADAIELNAGAGQPDVA